MNIKNDRGVGRGRVIIKYKVKTGDMKPIPAGPINPF